MGENGWLEIQNRPLSIVSYFACLEHWITLFKHVVEVKWFKNNNESTYNYKYTCTCYYLLDTVQGIVFSALLALFSLILTTTLRERQCNPYCKIKRLKERLGKFSNLPRIILLFGTWRWYSNPGIFDSKDSSLTHFAYLLFIKYIGCQVMC